ncbi:hypothetical protein ES703_27107 [subsurface metagenome]
MSLGEIVVALIGGLTFIGAIIWRFHLLALQVERIKTKVEDLWDILLEDGRLRISDLRASSRLSEKGKAMVPDDIKQAIAQYREECHNDCEIAGHDIICLIKKSLGIARLSADAKERHMSLLEYVALLADYYED